MIKLPAAIVIYPQEKKRPGYLLCWIPAKDYKQVAKNKLSRENLSKYYPEGIEVELSTDGFNEFGIKLSCLPEKLRKAYLDLAGKNLLPESGMIEETSLAAYLSGKKGDQTGAAVAKPVEGTLGRDVLTESAATPKIFGAPPMTDGEDAIQVFRRLSNRQDTER